jgi:hypothetical protein
LVKGIRAKPYLTQIVSTILWRFTNKSAKVRMQAADLAARLAVVIKNCGEDGLLSKLGVVLFEHLGEEYPDTLGRYGIFSTACAGNDAYLCLIQFGSLVSSLLKEPSLTW